MVWPGWASDDGVLNAVSPVLDGSRVNDAAYFY